MFQELAQVMSGNSLIESINLTIKVSNNEVTVLASPILTGSKVSPVSFKGTPEELDNEFAKSFIAVLQENKEVIQNIADLKKSIKDLKTKKEEKLNDSNKSSSSSSSKPAAKKKDSLSEDEAAERAKKLAGAMIKPKDTINPLNLNFGGQTNESTETTKGL